MALLLSSRSSQRRLLAQLLLPMLLSRRRALSALELEHRTAMGVLKGTPGLLELQALSFGLLALQLLVVGLRSAIIHRHCKRTQQFKATYVGCRGIIRKRGGQSGEGGVLYFALALRLNIKMISTISITYIITPCSTTCLNTSGRLDRASRLLLRVSHVYILNRLTSTGAIRSLPEAPLAASLGVAGSARVSASIFAEAGWLRASATSCLLGRWWRPAPAVEMGPTCPARTERLAEAGGSRPIPLPLLMPALLLVLVPGPVLLVPALMLPPALPLARLVLAQPSCGWGRHGHQSRASCPGARSPPAPPRPAACPVRWVSVEVGPVLVPVLSLPALVVVVVVVLVFVLLLLGPVLELPPVLVLPPRPCWARAV